MGHPNNRLYIGNIPNNQDQRSIHDQLQTAIHKRTGISSSSLEIEVKNRHAFVTGPIQLQQLRGIKLSDGTKLVVQKAMEKTGFGGWSKPSKPRAPPSTVTRTAATTTVPKDTTASPEKEEIMRHPLTVGQTEDIVQSVLEEHQADDDPISTLLASAAAVTMALSAVEIVDGDKDASSSHAVQEDNVSTKAEGTLENCSLGNQSLDALLQEYGEQDTDWKKVVVVPSTTPESNSSAPDQAPENRLGQLGRAPIHVVITSFGYRHGVPTAPGSVIDCRTLDPLPNHLLWMDGQSRVIRSTMLRNSRPDATDTARSVAQTTAETAVAMLQTAVHEHGYGYVSPATLAVYVGSDWGRHRSVVVAELAGTALRKLLRVNAPQIAVPVSVACSHRDIQKSSDNSSRRKGSSGRRRKGEDDDDDDEHV